MRRTLLVTLAPAAVLTAAWLHLESPVDRPLRSVAVLLLAVVPALARPLAARVAAVLASALVGAWLAFDVSPLHPLHFLGALGSHASNGFLDFYDVKTPFDPRVHTEMRGVILVAVFGFALAVALAVASRRPLIALLVLLAGAGWPATLRGNSGAAFLGVIILLAALAILAGLSSRPVPRAALPAAVALVLAALAASTSTAIAKGGLVAWQQWDLYNAPQPPVSVEFVWNAQYEGLRFPRKRTTVLEVRAPRRSLYWRAALLDSFTGDRWLEGAPLLGDALEPAKARSELLRQDVQVLALADTRLVGASVPVRYDAGDAPIVSHVPGVASLPSGLTRGFHYTAWSYAPRPTPAQLGRSKPVYPVHLIEPGTFLDVWRGVTVPPFGARAREASVADIIDLHPGLERYTPLAHAAFAVAGSARTPYAAAAALDAWFRSRGGFVYTNRPAVYAAAPLVGFVAQTRAGYCQHFAGAMALMLRYLGVPARVAVGFSSGTFDGKRGVWKVTDHDAHAWVEAWFRGYGWLPFDPTPTARPGRGQLSAPYAAAARLAAVGPVGGSPRTSVPGDPRQSAHRHGDAGPAATAASQAPAGAHGARSGSLVLLLVLVLAAAAATVVATKLVVRRARYVTRDPRRVAAACRHELADFLLDQQIDAARSATLHELGAIVRDELTVDPDAFVAAATAARFGPPDGAPAAAKRARRELRALMRDIRRRLRTVDRTRGLLSLRSLGFAP